MRRRYRTAKPSYKPWHTVTVRSPFDRRDALNRRFFRGERPPPLAEDFIVRTRGYSVDTETDAAKISTRHTFAEIVDTAEPGRVQIIRAPADDAKFPARAAFARITREGNRKLPKPDKFKGVAVTREITPEGRLRVTWLDGAGEALLIPGPDAEKVIAKIERGLS